MSDPTCRAVRGVCSAGLMTTVFPQLRAGAIFHMNISKGKFHWEKERKHVPFLLLLHILSILLQNEKRYNQTTWMKIYLPTHIEFYLAILHLLPMLQSYTHLPLLKDSIRFDLAQRLEVFCRNAEPDALLHQASRRGKKITLAGRNLVRDQAHIGGQSR